MATASLRRRTGMLEIKNKERKIKEELKNREVKEPEVISEEEHKKRMEALKGLKLEVKELSRDIELFKRSPEYHRKLSGYKESLIRASNQILWIKHFFNLTEEDLKGEQK